MTEAEKTRFQELKAIGYVRLKKEQKEEYNALKVKFNQLPPEGTPPAQPAGNAPEVPVVPQAQSISTPEEKLDFTKYKQLPPPIIEHLERRFGNWLNHFEVGSVYKEAFGGYGMYIKVPRQFSTEWQDVTVAVYNNETHKKIGEKKTTIPDIRWKNLNDIAAAKRWIDVVQNHIITNAYRKGIQLPSTNTAFEDKKQTIEDYTRSLHK